MNYLVELYVGFGLVCGTLFFAGLQLTIMIKLILALAEWIGDTLTGRNRVTTRSKGKCPC